MELRRITDEFSVSPQVDPEHMHEIAGAGFRSVICNRPDGEEMGQCDYNPIAEAAKAEGLEVQCIPISSGFVTPDALDEFRKALEEMPKPILAYCRTGTRCTMLWSIAEHGRRADDEIVELAAKAGYDMSGLIRQLQQR